MSTLKSGLVITCLSTADNFGVRRSLRFASAVAAGGESGGDPLTGMGDTFGYSFDPPLRSPNVKMSGPPEAPARAKK